MIASRSLGLVLAAASLIAMASCAVIPATWSETRTLTVASDAGSLDVRTASGSIEVRRAAVQEMKVEASFRAQSEERLAEMAVLAEPDGRGGVAVSVKWPADGRKSNEGCSIRVLVPSANGVRMTTSNGKVVAAGLSGELTIESSNGSVEVTDQRGPVSVKTSNGRITLTNVDGRARAKSSNGAIRIHEVRGPVVADTSNGSVAVRLLPDSTEPFEVSTSNGSVRVEVGPAYSGTVEARTSNGRVRADGAGSVEGSRSTATAVFGGGGRRSRVTTSNGGVEVVRAEAGTGRG